VRQVGLDIALAGLVEKRELIGPQIAVKAPKGLILWSWGYASCTSRLRLTTKSTRRRGSREGADWGAVKRIAAVSAVTRTRPATKRAD